MNVELFLDHPAPTRGEPLTVRALLRITGHAPDGGARTPLNLALVLDRSGSMAGDKLRFARDAAALLVRRLWPEDTVGVVAFDDTVATLVSQATADAHAEAVERIRALTSGSTTNLSGGWLRGRELVEEALREGGVNRVILMTDGLANVGITDPAALQELCRTAAAAGVSTTTIGFGRDFDEDLLRAMADAGGGAAYYIENPDQAPGIFEEEVEGLLSLSVQNLSVEVTPGTDVDLAAIRHSYPARPSPGSVRLDVGDLYAREPRLVLMEFRLHEGAPDTELNVASIQLQGDVLTADGGVERRVVDLPVRLRIGHGPRVDPEVRRVATLLEAGRARDEALERRGDGDWDGAARVLEATATHLEDLMPDDPEAAREAKDLRKMAHNLDERSFDLADVKYMKQSAHDVQRSRMAARERYRRG